MYTYKYIYIHIYVCIYAPVWAQMCLPPYWDLKSYCLKRNLAFSIKNIICIKFVILTVHFISLKF